MRKDIINFLKLAQKRYGKLDAYYIPVDDLYVVTKNGKAVQNFKSYHFYQQPKYFRLKEWGGMIGAGMVHNMGERQIRDQLTQVRGMGKKILI